MNIVQLFDLLRHVRRQVGLVRCVQVCEVRVHTFQVAPQSGPRPIQSDLEVHRIPVLVGRRHAFHVQAVAVADDALQGVSYLSDDEHRTEGRKRL